jgi:hypothetical protein
LGLTCDGLLANFAFDFTVRRYIEGYIAIAYVVGAMAMSVGVWAVGSCGREACSLTRILFVVITVSSVCSGRDPLLLLATSEDAIATQETRVLNASRAVDDLVGRGTNRW